jgi:hypothetical protein
VIEQRGDGHSGDDRVVERDPWQGTFDRDLDWEPRQSPGLVEGSFEASQRLVANPLLAVATWVAGVALIRASLRSHHFAVFVAGVGLLFLAFFLLQFHCLDCGRTGWLLRYGRHACPRVKARWRNREFRRVRGPGLMTQLVLWSYFLVAAFLVSMILMWSRP